MGCMCIRLDLYRDFRFQHSLRQLDHALGDVPTRDARQGRRSRHRIQLSVQLHCCAHHT